MNNKKDAFFLKTNRLEALSDGVFAIVMTLLVIELIIPSVPKLLAANLAQKLLEMWPKFLAFAISFLVLGIIWYNHHYQFGYIKRSNGILAWINIFLLLSVSLMPFSTALIGEYNIHSKVATIFWGINSLVIVLLCNLIWWYASGKYRLIDPDIEPKVVLYLRISTLAVATLFIIGIALSFISPFIGIVIYTITALSGIVIMMFRGRSR
jgi:uncharacterized membrane protein